MESYNSELAYSAMIVQGNTEDVGDCKVFYEELKKVPNGNSYVNMARDCRLSYNWSD